MGKAIGVMSELSGKIGPLIFSQKKSGKTAVYEAPVVKDTPTRTRKQMLLRLTWGNLGAVYSQFNKTLKRGHENLESGRTDYNAFISENTKMTRVYLSKYDVQNGGCVLAPYQITHGRLPSILYDLNGDNVMVTDVETGALVIDAETTVSDFSIAVLTLNDDFEEGDQLTFFHGIQTVDEETGAPRAKIRGWKVKLDVTDETPLWNVVSGLGFCSVGGYLGMNQEFGDCATAWIHSREDEQGNLKVSTQRLKVNSSVLQSYMGDAAFDASVASYGGITSKKVFLHPDEDTNLGSTGINSSEAGGQSSGSGQNGGSGGQTGGQTGGGSDTGGGQSGGQTGGGDTGGQNGGQNGGSGGGDDDENT